MPTKEEILEAIRREAAKNGGQALGRLRFQKATGIRESDWAGKHWAKWSDAVIEAGLSPNTRQRALPTEDLLDRYAGLVRELEHAPTNTELRMAARRDASFPSHSTFSTRFGSKRRLIEAVVEHCAKSAANQSLLPLLQEELRSLPSVVDDECSEAARSDGYVYLMKFGQEYKIGTSKNVQRRLQQLRTQMPYEGEIVHTISTGDPEGIEAYWHQYFADRRLKGEWFKLTDADVRYFKKRKLM